MGDNAFTERIKIKYHADITKIEKIAVGDWIDLRCAEDVVMHEGELKIFSLGISMQLPTGFEAIVAPRSSCAKNYGIILANSIGIIDESYCGNDDVWRFIAYAIRDTHIPFDTRVAQFRIMKHQNPLEFIEVEELKNANRGGIGSTGRI